MRPNINPMQYACQVPLDPEKRKAEWEKIKPLLASLLEVIREQLQRERDGQQ